MEYAKTGDRVRVHYKTELEDGTLVDSSEGREPLEFVVGEGQLIPGFDQAIVGMSPGQPKKQTIPSDQAYGPKMDDLVRDFNVSEIDPENKLRPGQEVEFKLSSGQSIHARVADLHEEKITIDANHPLAGEDLVFQIELVEIVE